MRLGAALGTALKRGARVVASRESRAGLPDDQARDHLRPQLDRRRRRRPARRCPAAVSRHLLKTRGLRRRLPRRRVAARPGGRSRSASSSRPGIQLTPALQKEIEKHFTRQELRRVAVRRGRRDHVPGARRARATRSDLLADARRRGDPRARLPDRRRLRLLGRVARAAARCSARSASRRSRRTPFASDAGDARRSPAARRVGQAKRLVAAVGADLGVVFDRAAERLYLIDERGARGPASSRRCCSSCACSARAAAQGKRRRSRSR